MNVIGGLREAVAPKSTKKKYCSHCGDLMNIEYFDRGFCEDTGNPIRRKRVFCTKSKKKWWSIFTDYEHLYHDSYTQRAD